MRAFSAVSSAVAAAAFLASSVLADVDPIVIKGSKFFYKTNGTEFFIKGVAYQQQISSNGTTGDVGNDYNDPLADPAACQRDIPFLQQLQTNTIRVYAVHPDKDHSQCMQMLQDAGIYVISDLSEPFTSINRDQPVWNDDLYNRYTSVIDDLQQYSNVLGFFAGNEVSNAVNNTFASAFVKAAVRDMKAYIKQKNYRTIGVGYATNDDASIRENLANYFNCGPSEDSIDFWGYNIYSWCGDSSFQQSGYDVRTEEFANYSVPAFFAEYGCNTPRPRVFTEVQALYGKQMTPVWSGGIVYMYFEEANEFGLVSISGNTVSKLPDFENLSSQMAKITPSGVNMNAYKPTNTAARACPVEDASWGAASNLPPTPNEELCGCMVKALSCVTSPNVQETDYNDLFGTVCGLVDGVCGGIAANATTGTYGAYGMCNAKEQLDYAFNAYYQNQVAAGNGASACDFKGAATTQSATAPTGNCKALISQAGSGGTGTVTSAPTGTGGSSSGGSSSSGSGSSSSKSGTAGIMTTPSLDLGMLHMGAYVFCAMLAGMGMILL